MGLEEGRRRCDLFLPMDISKILRDQQLLDGQLNVHVHVVVGIVVRLLHLLNL